jgi:ribonuclease HI
VSAFEIYTDGCCAPSNPGPGGYAAVILSEAFADGSWIVSGGEPDTTNNRMELRAAIESLCAIPGASTVRIITDSKYVRDGFTKWLPKWKQRGWRTASKEPVKNVDLWKALDVAVARHAEVGFFWMRGHLGNRWNERADEVAALEAEKWLDVPAWSAG